MTPLQRQAVLVCVVCALAALLTIGITLTLLRRGKVDAPFFLLREFLRVFAFYHQHSGDHEHAEGREQRIPGHDAHSVRLYVYETVRIRA